MTCRNCDKKETENGLLYCPDCIEKYGYPWETYDNYHVFSKWKSHKIIMDKLELISQRLYKLYSVRR